VATLVAHEPPVALLLPDADQAAAGIHEIYDIYRQSGSRAAWKKFGSFTGLDTGPEDPDPPPLSAEEEATNERFFEHGLLTIALYHPDLAALHAAPTRLIVAGGTASRGQFPQRTAAALAERLDSPLLDFPGGHVGFMTEPEEFAAVLRRALT
jgi:pimeloyl-ACP methyl ester carboxylesterase